jgi:predicted ATPase/class 3 adenylate cyclase
MTDRSRRTATFLFTDIEGSTQLWSDFPDQMPEVIERHDSLLDAAIEAEGGTVMQHTGDGIDAVFDDPVAAVSAAVRGQRAIVTADWSRLPGLGVRIGIHTGEALERDGGFLGSTLNMAARLRDAAHGGQVLVSEPVASSLRERPVEGCSVADLGTHRLRGLPNRHRIHQIHHPELPERFADLRTLDMPDALHIPATSFHGRMRERDELSSLLGSAHAVTLIGPGGVGKTRLAVEVAVEAGHRFRGGVLMIDLVRADAADAVDIMADELGVVRRAGRSAEDATIDWLIGKELLLVVDNCEHVAEVVGSVIGRASAAAPEVTFLCTSRQRLGFPGETSYVLESLEVPDDDDVERLARSPVVQLFADRVAAARYGFELTPENVVTVATICRRLDGIPLALELAAARARSMSLEDIETYLHPGSPILTSSAPYHPHHRTLQATIDWSYDLLPAELRVTFERMSVFVGPFTIDAARAVWQDDRSLAEVLSDLADLSDRSMLVAHIDDHESRYRMLTPLRDDAARRLDERGGTEACRDLHARYHAQLVEQAEHGLLTDAEPFWVFRLREALGDIEAAHAWALQQGEHELALRVVLALWNHGLQGLSPEYFRWVDQTLEVVDADAHPRAADLHGIAALSAWLRGDSHGIATRCLAAFAAEQRLGSGVTLPARMAAIVATAYAPEETDPQLAELDREIAMRFLEVVDACRASGTPYWIVYSLVTGSLGRSMAGELDHAAILARRALEAARRSGCPTSLAWSLLALGSAAEQTDPDQAERLLAESVRASKEVDSRLVMGLSLSLLAVLLRRLRRPRDAAPLVLELLDHWDRLGNRPQGWHAIREGAMCLALVGQDELAVELLASVDHADLVMPLLPADRRDLTTLEDELRSRLGDDVFEHARLRGHDLGREEAAGLARAALSRLPSPAAATDEGTR